MFKRVWGWGSFVAAGAFVWGGLEALVNRWRPPSGTYHPTSLLESLHSRALFYGVALAAITLVLGAAAFLLRKIFRRKPPAARGWPAAAAFAFAVVFNVGWLAAGWDYRTALVSLGPLSFDLRFGGPFLAYWGIAAGLAILVAVVLSIFVARRRWWRGCGRVLRPALAAAFVVAVGWHPLMHALRPVPRGPNIVFVVLDAWRADALNAETMPKVYTFANGRAVYYPRTWSCASWTLPSMGSIFTGSYPDSHGGRAGPTADRFHPSVAQILYRAGYDTAAITANRLLDRHNPIAAGFHDFDCWDWWPPLRWIRFYDTNWYGPAARALCHRRDLNAETSEVLTAKLEAYLNRPHRRPYFLWVHYMDPHQPYTPPSRYRMGSDEAFISINKKLLPENAYRYRRLYLGECSYLDDLLDPVLARVDASPGTVLVLTGDHGEEFWEHGWGDHGGSVYDTVCRVPLVIRYPGVEPLVDPSPVSQIDLATTFLAWANVRPADSMVGEAIYPAGDGPQSPTTVYMGSIYVKSAEDRPRCDAAVQWPRKLVLPHKDPDGPGEYYDLALDPYEQRPLPNDTYAESLRIELKKWTKAHTPKKGGEEGVASGDVRDMKALGYVK